MRRLIYRNLGTVLYFVMFFFGAYVLWYGVDQHLFGPPQPGLDQHSILNCALDLVKGKLPAEHYRYSYSYTAFLTLLALLSGGKLWLMRLLQLAVAALIPAVVCRTARLCRTGRTAAFAAGLLCCASAPLVLISLDFLRAAPLALAFVSMRYFMLAAEFRRGRGDGKKADLLLAAAGACGALCVLGRENFLAVVCWAPLLLWCARDRRGAAIFCGTLILPLLAVLVFNGIRYHSFQLVPGNVGNILGFYGGEAGNAGNVRNVLLSVPRHLRDMASSYELDNSLSVYAHREIVTPLKILCLPFNLLWLLGAAGAFLNRRERGTKWAAVFAAAYVASMLFFTVFYRFRVPVIPLLAVPAAGAFRHFASMWRKRRYRSLAAWAAGIAALFALTWVFPDSRRTADERSGVAYLLVYNRRIAEAKEYLDDMTRRGQDSRNGRLLLVGQLADDRRFAEAEAYLEEMTSGGFDAATGWYYLAAKLHEAGDISGANRAFSRFEALSRPR
ncbi:MAG: hypothetical protein J6Y54_06945 [Lentisphaeria bacterium]|nr:hypothetical protein [Lentisphaeria bacterium]